MPRNESGGIGRREFLKRTAAGGVALAFGPHIWIPRPVLGAVEAATLHPNLNPLRVVGVQDNAFTTDLKPTATWVQQEPLVKADRVAAAIDRMACALAEEKEPKTAWQKVFVKPPQKAWNEVVVAIKTNQIARQRTRSAVVAKVCHVLTDELGVKGSNIFIYDGVHGGRMSQETRFAGLPEGVNLANQWGGIKTQVPVPKPFKDGAEQSRCLDHLAKGTIDILVNIALCKGHGNQFGGFTMAMKNHFGSFDPQPSHRAGGGADYLIAVNKTPQILGTLEEKTGKVLFPRQQLVLVDALWASRPGPGGEATHQTNSLFMGVSCPVVDYQVARQFRRDRMTWPINEEVTDRFLSDLGIAAKDLPNEGKIIDVSDAPSGAPAGAQA